MSERLEPVDTLLDVPGGTEFVAELVDAMAAEGAAEGAAAETRRRVVNRLLWDDPKGPA